MLAWSGPDVSVFSEYRRRKRNVGDLLISNAVAESSGGRPGFDLGPPDMARHLGVLAKEA